MRRRLHAQRLTGEPFESVAEAVRRLGAVQAQEFAEVKWSLAERTNERTDAAVEAAFARGDVIRTHVLRPTWHLVAREDVRWLLRLSRPRVHAANAYWYRKFELDARTLRRAHSTLARTLADGPRTRRELVERLEADGIEAGGLRLGYLLMHAELEELMCSGPRAGKQQTYALLDDRVPTAPLDDRPPDQALEDLVLRYFTVHGPATVADFAAWSGFTITVTRAALESLAGRLEQEDEWYAAPGAPAPAASTGAFLIPMYDETIVAYKDLRVVLAHPLPAPGTLERPVVIDGRTVGSWRRTLARRSATVEVHRFGSLGAYEQEALAAAVDRFGTFLGVPATLT